MAYLDLQRSMRENFEVAEQYLFSRMPLCNGGMDHIVGLLPTREFLSAYNAAGETSVLQLLVRPAVFAPERIALDRLLALFHEHRTQFIFLADEHGGVEGIVTLRDVVDELLGESSPAPVVAADEPFEAPGDMPVHELAARLGKPDWAAERSAVTVGGFVTELLGPEPFADYELIEVDPSESCAANCLPIGNSIIYPTSFPKTRARLEEKGYKILSVEVDELAKAEGAVTCCSFILAH